MNLQDNINPLKSNTSAQHLDAPDRGRCTAGDIATSGLILRKERKPRQCECTSCMYYDPERTYCNYIHAPVDILFVCPQVLDNRR